MKGDAGKMTSGDLVALRKKILSALDLIRAMYGELPKGEGIVVKLEEWRDSIDRELIGHELDKQRADGHG